MALAERVLVDTSAFYAIHSATDLFHDRARAAYERLTDRDQKLYTTSYTLVETIVLLHNRLGFEVVSRFSEWQQSSVEVFWIDSRVHTEAWDRFMAHEGRGLSFVDWTTVLASYEIGAPVFTFDGGFAKQGLAVVPH